MAEPDAVAVALEAALTPSLAEAAAEVDAWTKATAARAANGWDFTSVGPAPNFPRLRLRSLRTLVAHAYATGEPCDGERCEEGGAAHCHRCAEVDADRLLAERDRLRAENRLLRALQHIPAGSCHRTTIHPPHRWLPSPATQHCPGLGPDITPAEEHVDVTVEYGFENMDRGGEGPMMIGRPVDEIRAVMADKRATFPEARYALRRRLVGPWESVGETQSTHAQPGDHDD